MDSVSGTKHMRWKFLGWLIVKQKLMAQYVHNYTYHIQKVEENMFFFS